MPTKPNKPTTPPPVAFPELEAAMRAIVATPKAEVEASIVKERKLKQKRSAQSK